MPTPYREREARERELREELPTQLADSEREPAAGRADKGRREFLESHIRRVRLRMADLEARLAKSNDS